MVRQGATGRLVERLAGGWASIRLFDLPSLLSKLGGRRWPTMRLPPVVAASRRNLETPERVQFDGRNWAVPVTNTHTTRVTEMPQLRRRQGRQPPKRRKYAQKLTNHVDKAAEERGCRQLYVCNFVFELCRSHDCRAAVL